MRVALSIAVFLFNVAASAQSVSSRSGIGDTAFDPRLDDPKFQVCNPDNVWQGYQLKSKQDETSLMVEEEFRTKYKYNAVWSKDAGLIRIRFIVNCKGVADRFRILEADRELKPTQFNKELIAHLLAIAKGIQWPQRRAWEQTVDYYHYISIRVHDGKIEIVQ